MQSKSRALFISRTGALKAGLEVALAEGYSHEECMQRVRHYPVHRRGCLVGYEAWVPHGAGARPLMEEAA